MINNGKNLYLNRVLNKSRQQHDYYTPTGRYKPHLYFLDKFNNLNKTEENSEYYNESNINNSNHDYKKNKNKYANNIFINNSNISKNRFQNFSLFDNSLSELYFKKYRQTLNNKNFEKEIDDFNKTQGNSYYYLDNEILMNINDINPSIQNKNKRTLSRNFRAPSEIKDERKTLNEEIHNFNFLVKKINKTIERSKSKHRERLNRKFGSNDIINYNNKNHMYKGGSLISEFTLNDNEEKNKKNKKHKNKKEIYMKKNSNDNLKEIHSEGKLNFNFIKYLKKDNEKLSYINALYLQIIDMFFYFINQISKKYSFKKEIKDMNYYFSNIKSLSNILIDLEEHLNKLIRIDMTKTKEKFEDINHELLGNSKFITINNENLNLEQNHNTKKTRTRNKHSLRGYLTQNSKNFISSGNYLNKTQFISNNDNVNEKIKKENNQNKKQNKIIFQKKNSRLIKFMSKLNSENILPKNKNINKKIIVNKNKALNNNQKNSLQNSKIKDSNDLKSLMNPKFYKDKK